MPDSGGELAPDAVWFWYSNWKGERALRRVLPSLLWFGTTEYHPEQQWLLKAFDLDKQANRDFAMKDISEWRPSAP